MWVFSELCCVRSSLTFGTCWNHTGGYLANSACKHRMHKTCTRSAIFSPSFCLTLFIRYTQKQQSYVLIRKFMWLRSAQFQLLLPWSLHRALCTFVCVYIVVLQLQGDLPCRRFCFVRVVVLIVAQRFYQLCKGTPRLLPNQLCPKSAGGGA